MRDLARWVGELLSGRGLPMRLVLLRAVLMGAAAVVSMAAAVHVLFAESEGPHAGGRLWQGLVVLSVALAIRGLFEVWELDGWLAVAAAGALAFGGIGWAAARNALEARAWAFGGVALSLVAIAVWRGMVAAKREDEWERAEAARIAKAAATAPEKKRRKRRA